MKKILFFLFTILCFSLNAQTTKINYGIVKLKNGLPDEQKRNPNHYKSPYFAVIPSSDLFNNIYFMWDQANPFSYTLMLVYKNNYSSVYGVGFPRTKGKLYKEGSFEYNDDYNSIVSYQIELDTNKNELKYYWTGSIENGVTKAGGSPQLVKPRLCMGKMMPEFNFKTFDDVVVSSEKYKNKFVFIDFWGTWCGGCKYELPNIRELREKISDEQLIIVGFAAYDEPDSLKKYLAQNPLDYPNVLIGQDYVDKCEVTSFPTTVLVAPGGKIIATNFRGEGMWKDVLAKMESYNK